MNGTWAGYLWARSGSMTKAIVSRIIVRFEARFSPSNKRRMKVGSRPESRASWYSLFPHSWQDLSGSSKIRSCFLQPPHMSVAYQILHVTLLIKRQLRRTPAPHCDQKSLDVNSLPWRRWKAVELRGPLILQMLVP